MFILGSFTCATSSLTPFWWVQGSISSMTGEVSQIGILVVAGFPRPTVENEENSSQHSFPWTAQLAQQAVGFLYSNGRDGVPKS
jgi:hypothetical protein